MPAFVCKYQEVFIYLQFISGSDPIIWKKITCNVINCLWWSELIDLGQRSDLFTRILIFFCNKLDKDLS